MSDYRDWTPGSGTGGFLLEKPWMGSAFTQRKMFMFSFREQHGSSLVPMHSGNTTHVGIHRGTKAPEEWSRYFFDIQFLHRYNEDWNLIQRLKNSGSTFNFCPGLRVTDVFDATSSNTYTLTRPVAAGVVTGLTTSTHPHEILLNGTSTPSAASISTQTVTANNTGTITVTYTPLFKVKMVANPATFQGEGYLVSSLALEEHISGDFG